MMSTLRTIPAIASTLLLLAQPAHAEVVGTPDASGFTVAGEVAAAAAPAQTWASLITIGSWWSSAHSWSGNAANMTLEPRANGCWCEAMPNGGSIQHGRVIAFVPGDRLLLDAALGPLQSMPVNGRLEWRLVPHESGGTTIRYRYQIWGQVPGDPAALARGVDAVMAEQARRLAGSLAAQ